MIGIPPTKPTIAGSNNMKMGIMPNMPGGAIKMKYIAVKSPIFIKSLTSNLLFSIRNSLFTSFTKYY